MSVYMCVLQSIASNSQREFNLSSPDTPASHSGRMLCEGSPHSHNVHKTLTRQRLCFTATQRSQAFPPLDPIIMLLQLLKQFREEIEKTKEKKPRKNSTTSTSLGLTVLCTVFVLFVLCTKSKLLHRVLLFMENLFSHCVCCQLIN